MFYLFLENNRRQRSAAKIFLTAMLTIVCIFAAENTARGQQNGVGLDSAFNGNGKLVVDLGNPDNVAGAVAVQPDGKIVVAGLTGTIDSAGENPGASDFVVLRFNANGTPDNSFNGNGRVVTSFGAGEAGAGAVLIQPDGKILVAGGSDTQTANGRIALVRYNSDGSLDAGFDNDGKVTTDAQQNVDERVEAMVLQPDSKILVAVSTVLNNPSDGQVYVVRYNADGSLDLSFAGDGTTTLPPAVPSGVAASDIALQPDGRIVVAGTVSTAENSDFFVWRINPNGTHDQTFGGRVVTASFGDSDSAVSVFVQPNGKILVAGLTFNPTAFRNDFAFARFNSDGSPDAAFNGNGKKITARGDDGFSVPFDFARQPDGKIVGVGTSVTGAVQSDASFAITRFDAEGNLDTAFGTNGKVETNFGAGLDAAFAVTVQTNGKIIAVGGAETAAETGNYNIAVARYVGGGTQRKTEFDFDGDGKSDISVFRATERSFWYYLRSGANNAFAAAQWGLASDRIAPADYDGDGKTDLAVWRGTVAGNPDKAYFYILNSSSNTFRAEQFGNSSDTPWSGDWDGDGRADVAVFRAAVANEQSRFYYRPSSAANVDFLTINWGLSGDEPVRGDFDGDGKLDAAVFRSAGSLWHIRQSSNGTARYESWGLTGDRRIPADYDGDNKTDVAVYRNGVWYIKQSSNAQPRYIAWGLNTDKPVPADYDGDGKTDAAIYRSGVWYVLASTTGEMKTINFGLPDDQPVQTAYLQ